MSLLGRIFKDISDNAAGRISWRSNMWAMVGGPFDRKRIQNEAMIGTSRVNEKGEFLRQDGKFVLVSKPNVRCPNPPAEGLFFDGKWHWTPRVLCVKCPYHRASTRRFRFPRCVFGKDEATVALRAVETFSAMTEKAMKDAQEIMGGAK